jgi:hypothetical protein
MQQRRIPLPGRELDDGRGRDADRKADHRQLLAVDPMQRLIAASIRHRSVLGHRNKHTTTNDSVYQRRGDGFDRVAVGATHVEQTNTITILDRQSCCRGRPTSRA